MADPAVMGDMQIGGFGKFLKFRRGDGEYRAGLAIERFGHGGADGEVDIGLHQDDSGGCCTKPDGFGKAPWGAAGTPAFQHHEDFAFEALAPLRMVNVDNASAAGIESAPEAQGFIEQKDGALGYAWVKRGHEFDHKFGSRQTSPSTALSTHSLKLPKQTATPSMPGA